MAKADYVSVIGLHWVPKEVSIRTDSRTIGVRFVRSSNDLDFEEEKRFFFDWFCFGASLRFVRFRCLCKQSKACFDFVFSDEYLDFFRGLRKILFTGSIDLPRGH